MGGRAEADPMSKLRPTPQWCRWLHGTAWYRLLIESYSWPGTVLEHVDWLERKLSGADERCVAGFALVMTSRLVGEFGPWIGQRCESGDTPLFAALKMAERQIRDGTPTPQDEILTVRQQVESVNWEEPVGEHEAMLSNGAMEALEASLCLLDVLAGNDGPGMAAASGERSLNFVDYRLNMVEGIDDTYSAPDFVFEIRLQRDLAEAFRASHAAAALVLAQEAVKSAPSLLGT